MKRLFLILATLLLCSSAWAATKVQVMTDGKIDVDKLPTIEFSLETDPASPEDGRIWWNETEKLLKIADPSGVYTFNGTLTAWDTTPAAFTFTDITNATTETLYTSNAITVSGINHPAAINVSGDASAKYSVNGGTATVDDGTVSVGDEVRAVVTSSADAATVVNATVTIGGVGDAFSVTTAAAVEAPYIDVDFESGEAPSGWTTAGAGRAYNSVSPALAGTYSFASGAANIVVTTSKKWTPSGSFLSGRFIYYMPSGNAGQCIINFRKDTQTPSLSFTHWGGGLTYVNIYKTGYTQSDYTRTLATAYIVWWELECVYGETGSRARIWVADAATTTTRPTTPTMTLTRTVENLDMPNELYLSSSVNSYISLDDIIVSSTPVTD